MRIGIIGAGNVGSTLGRGWAKAGHTIGFGVRRPNSAELAQLIQAIGADKASAGSPRAVAQASEVVVLATPWPVTIGAVRDLGDLGGKIVIDCTNPLTMGPDGLALEIGHDTSGAEMIAAQLPEVPVFKTLNQVGFDVMAQPRFAIGATPMPAVMFVAGDDADGKRTVLALVADAGFEAIDAGGLRAARLLEPFAMLWIELARKRGLGSDFAFALHRKA